MALTVKCSCWMLVMSVCLILSVKAECGKDCAYCAYHLQEHQAEINAVTCTLECEGRLGPTKFWDLCRDVLAGKKADASTEAERVALETDDQENDDHQLAKKYGGFMKRYGGFMKKTAELYNLEPEDESRSREILAKRYGGFMKKDAESGVDTVGLLKEILNGGGRETESHGDRDGETMKRYGGFMRSVRRSQDLEDGIKELQKRYGGFMRRVGRPEWKEDQKRYGGFLKRSRDEDGESNSEDVPDMEKRYGGFMGY